MLDLITYVIILLIIAFVGMSYIIRVIIAQLKLFKKPITVKEIRHFRNILFTISLVIIVAGTIPIVINIYTLFFPTGRPPVIPLVSVIYSLGVHIQSLLLSYLLWQIYKLASKQIDK